MLHYALRGRFAVRLDDAGITVVRPWSRRRVPWAEVGGIRFTPLPVEEDDIAWWAVTTTVGAARTLPLAAVRDTDEPAFGTLRRHGLLFRPFADRGLGVLGTPEDSRTRVLRAGRTRGRGPVIGRTVSRDRLRRRPGPVSPAADVPAETAENA
ncbi:PH domain-containing protein [Streptomyces sp. NPDC056304]|uniref:PH domain-containing protein n=1 Tax=Streptomyces sp. NPDC056304 TaxID=3345778 RepID=UPI0035DD67C7